MASGNTAPLEQTPQSFPTRPSAEHRATTSLHRLALAAVSTLAMALGACGDSGGTPSGGDSGTDGGTPSGDGGADPCNGVTTGGRCMSTSSYQHCEITSENAANDARLVTEMCGAGETCQEADGRARCAQPPSRSGMPGCREGATACGAGTTLRTCTMGAWVDSACPEACETSQTGAQCVTTANTRMLTGRFVFQRRRPEPADMPRDWGMPEDAPGRGFSVGVLRGSTLIGSAVTSADAATAGQFTVRAPDTAMAGDSLVVAAIQRDAEGSARVVIADPMLPAGMQSESAVDRVTNPTAWQWRFDLAMPPADGVFRVSESEGSGVANVFDVHAMVYRSALAHYGQPPFGLLIWMGRGAQWPCGACVGSNSVQAFGTRFENQEWFPYDNDMSMFSDSVIGHEAGHWIMNAYGRSPGEGGGHTASVPAFPGLAWSDGWATGYSSLVRADPMYVDKQNGSMFWSNISTRTSTDGARPRPAPNGPDVMPSSVPGLLQRMGEEEVSAILWVLGSGGMNLPPIYNALASPRMRTPSASGAFERGYLRHSYDFTSGQYRNIATSREPAPTLPDFLDALLCSGFPRDTVDRATEPMMFYPFPSDRTMCRP